MCCNGLPFVARALLVDILTSGPHLGAPNVRRKPSTAVRTSPTSSRQHYGPGSPAEAVEEMAGW
jgi:hypothetical protein